MIQIFKEKNIKETKPRLKVYNLFLENEDLSLKEILASCNEIDKSTIYRIIEFFLEKEIIIKKINNNNKIIYELNDHYDKHYIKCIKCHRKVIIDLCPLENIDTKGFKIVKHSIIIDGICKKCLNKWIN